MGRQKKEEQSVGVLDLSMMAVVFTKRTFVDCVMTLYHVNQISCWTLRKHVVAPVVRLFVKSPGSNLANDQ